MCVVARYSPSIIVLANYPLCPRKLHWPKSKISYTKPSRTKNFNFARCGTRSRNLPPQYKVMNWTELCSSSVAGHGLSKLKKARHSMAAASPSSSRLLNCNRLTLHYGCRGVSPSGPGHCLHNSTNECERVYRWVWSAFKLDVQFTMTLNDQSAFHSEKNSKKWLRKVKASCRTFP